jgi:hypothetical protein
MKYVDMAMTPEEAKEYNSPTSVGKMPKYPYNLSISFCKDELEKLELDINDIEIGDFLHLHSMARVTSKSNYETEEGECPRLELTLAFLEVEDEAMEDEEEEDKSLKNKLPKLYR